MTAAPLPLQRGDFVDVHVAGSHVYRGMVVLAAQNGYSLMVLFDGLVDGCVGALPLFYDGAAYRNVMTGREVHVVPAGREGQP